ncbi:MAG: hypothetical protein PVH38_04025 [Gammaproteobacteria bacterium]|jgi:ligand-binding SRPBCC domain-containing protein
MFQFTESVSIAAQPDDVWNVFEDIEKWWPPSNPAHVSIAVNSSGNPVEAGTEVNFEERIAGIRGKASGSISRWIPAREARWEGEAVYRYYGISFRIQERVSWLFERRDKTTLLSAHVSAEFPPSLFGRFIEWYAIKILDIVDRDREHARRELEYLKSRIETAG